MIFIAGLDIWFKLIINFQISFRSISPIPYSQNNSINIKGFKINTAIMRGWFRALIFVVLCVLVLRHFQNQRTHFQLNQQQLFFWLLHCSNHSSDCLLVTYPQTLYVLRHCNQFFNCETLIYSLLAFCE